jgi:DNA modification methylase
MPMRQHEQVLVFYDKLPTYNPQTIRCEPHQRNHSRGHGKHQNTNNCYGKFSGVESSIIDFKYPSTIVKFPKGHSKEDWLHGTAKPVNLLRWLIRTYSNEGDLVLDNFVGSGSTIIAAIEEKRDWIGIELSEKYFEIAKKRINDRLREPTLF